MALTPSMYNRLKKGDKAPDFSLRGIDGKTYSLKNFHGKKAVLVVFMCNHCPYVKHKIGTIVSLHKEFRDKDVAVIGINSNDPLEYPEDNLDGMRKFSKERNITFPYLVDETQETAKAYGATCTPDPFLLDSSLRLAYHGRFDDALEPGTTAKTQEMKEAIQQLLSGKQVTIQERPSLGCNIKWKA
ncbi:MAG: thioredoxin family protein [Candidatus Aenigmarchaeota archaeon]|nr:thioredoxin family protein [Candidatus Aenigmarchaeota archaeon]